MGRTHDRIAYGILKLREKIDSDMLMPIGMDGVVIGHLIDPHCNLDNAVYISSKVGLSDLEKFGKILEYADARTVYALDLRTKTGSLGEMLKQMGEDWKNKTGKLADVRYTVLFDPNNRADIHAFDEELSDEERIIWTDKYTYQKMFVRENEKYQYNISHTLIRNFHDVKEIRKSMLNDLLYQSSY